MIIFSHKSLRPLDRVVCHLSLAEALIRLLNHDGYNSISLHDVLIDATRARLVHSVRAVFHHFASA
jgi:DNA-directed RNA polymerase specialized sigma54-like protein